MKTKILLLILFIVSVWSFIFYGSFTYQSINKKDLITKGETEIGFQLKGNDTILYIKGATTKAIKMLFERIDYLQNGKRVMKETYVPSKEFSL